MTCQLKKQVQHERFSDYIQYTVCGKTVVVGEGFRFTSVWLEQLARAYFREVILPKPPE